MANTTTKFLNWITPAGFKNDDKQYVGIGKFRAFVEISSDVTFTATAPDVVCEDLTTAQDSVINAPKTFTIVGEVADIYIENEIESGFGTVLEKALNSATPFLPDRTLSQIQKIEDFANNIENQITAVANTIDSGLDIAESILGVDGESEKTNKEKFFEHIQRYYDTKQFIAIEIQGRIYENVLITSFSYTETNDGDTGDFSISFKEIRIVSIDLFRDGENLTPSEEAKKKPNTTISSEVGSITDKGLSQGILVSIDKTMNILSKVTGGF